MGSSTAGSTPLGPGGGGGHDAAHAGVALPHLQGGGDDLGEHRPRQRDGAGLHLPGIPAGEVAGGAPGRVVALHGLHHGPPQTGHFFPGGVPFPAPVPEIVGEDGLPQGHVTGGAQQAFHRDKGHFTPPPPY